MLESDQAKKVQTNHVWSRHGSEQNIWCRQGIQQHEGTDVTGKLKLCPKTQKANQRPLNLDKQRCEGFGTDRAFAYKIEIGRVIPFESTPNGWNLTVELEAPTDANSKLQEIMDIMMTETRSEQTEKAEHMRGLPHAIILLTGRCVFFTTFSIAEL